MTNIWNSPLGKEQRGEEGRKNMPGLIVRVSSGGYTIVGLSQVLVVILLKRSWIWRTDLSAAVTAAHGRHTGAQCSTPPEVSSGQYWSLTPHTASSIPGPHYCDHFPQHLLFFLLSCWAYSRGCGALQVGHVSDQRQRCSWGWLIRDDVSNRRSVNVMHESMKFQEERIHFELYV